MREVTLEFQIKRGSVDIEGATEETMQIHDKCLEFCRGGKYEEGVNFLLPNLAFEWLWSNGDGDPADFFDADEDISFDCNKENCRLRIGNDEGSLIITASVKFTLKAKTDCDTVKLADWLRDKAMYACGYVGVNGWRYAGSDGDNVWITP